MECRLKRGQNCNNSCPLLWNTECFPAIWTNKHSLAPLGVLLRGSLLLCSPLWVDEGLRCHGQRRQASNVLLISTDETGNNSRIWYSLTQNGILCLFCLSGSFFRALHWDNTPLCLVTLRSAWGNQHPAPGGRGGRQRHSDLPGRPLSLHGPAVAGLPQSDDDRRRVRSPAQPLLHLHLPATVQRYQSQHRRFEVPTVQAAQEGGA